MTDRAPIGAALLFRWVEASVGATDGGAASPAWKPPTVVDKEAAPLDGLSRAVCLHIGVQQLGGGLVEASDRRSVDLLNGSEWPDTFEKQGLTLVDVADASAYLLIE